LTAIPLDYKIPIIYEDITINIPEPEAFTLHKLIVCCLRKNPDKAIKDAETAHGMLMFFEGKPDHIMRIHEIYDRLPKGWKQRVNDGLKKVGIALPSI